MPETSSVRHVLITGASRGIGAGIARALLPGITPSHSISAPIAKLRKRLPRRFVRYVAEPPPSRQTWRILQAMQACLQRLANSLARSAFL